jgi:hypothetical protein
MALQPRVGFGHLARQLGPRLLVETLTQVVDEVLEGDAIRAADLAAGSRSR